MPGGKAPFTNVAILIWNYFAQNQKHLCLTQRPLNIYLQPWTRNNVALNVPVLDHTDLKKKKDK